MEKAMKPCGYLYSQGQTYFLLEPQPIPRDSQWNDGTYTFFVAYIPLLSRDLPTRAIHIVTNSFCIEYVDVDDIKVKNILDEEESVPVEPVEWWDNLSKKSVIEEEFPF